KEVLELILTSFIVSLISSFRLWGVDGVVDVSYGMENLFSHFIFNSFVIIIFITTMKIYGLYNDFKIIYQINKIGLLISFFLALGTNGYFKFYTIGFLSIKNSNLRLGKNNFKPNFDEYSKVLFYGILSLIFIFFLSNNLSSVYLNQIVIIGICSLIPFPKNFGFFSIYSDLNHHIMLSLFFILSVISINFMPFVLSVSFSIIIALVLSNYFSEKFSELI
ncbi:MAG: hypothetical protein ACOCRX_04555, partial [Candidatus Woesearchaeota archaeon]